VKGTELANLCAGTIDETAHAAHAGIDRVRHDKDLAFAFLAHCGPSLGRHLTCPLRCRCPAG
jgi:hypothetical protein